MILLSSCADLFSGHFTFELWKAEQHIQRQTPQTCCRVERLRHRGEPRPCPVEPLDQLGKVCERPGQAVDLVDHDPIDPTCLHVGHQSLQRRTIRMPTRNAAVIVPLFDRHPAFVALARDVGLTRLALRIERIEVLLAPFLARLAGVDGAAGLCHADRFPVRPKKRGPDQAVPVIRFATAESER